MSKLDRMDEPCCICGSEEAVEDDLLVYCDGPGCNIGVHQKCYGVKKIPKGLWLCLGCRGKNGGVQMCCSLCPNKYGAFKKTETGGWAHVVCAMYIPGARFFDDEKTGEPMIYLETIPSGRFDKLCYICSKVEGACMSCKFSGCSKFFHPTCAQPLGILYQKTLKGATSYLGYCEEHIQGESNAMKKLPAFRVTSSLDQEMVVSAGDLLPVDTKEHEMEPGSDASNGDFSDTDTLSDEVIDLTNDSVEEDVVDEFRFESFCCEQAMQSTDLPVLSPPKSINLEHVVETPRLTSQVVPKRRRSLNNEWSTSISTTPNWKPPGRSGTVLNRDFMRKRRSTPSPSSKSIGHKNSRESFVSTSSAMEVANPTYSGQLESTVDAGNGHSPGGQCKALVLWHPPPLTEELKDASALLFTPPRPSATEDVPPLLFTPSPVTGTECVPASLCTPPPANSTEDISSLLFDLNPELLQFAEVSDISQLLAVLHRLKAENRALEALVEHREQRKMDLQNEIQVLSEPIDFNEIV